MIALARHETEQEVVGYSTSETTTDASRMAKRHIDRPVGTICKFDHKGQSHYMQVIDLTGMDGPRAATGAVVLSEKGFLAVGSLSAVTELVAGVNVSAYDKVKCADVRIGDGNNIPVVDWMLKRNRPWAVITRNNKVVTPDGGTPDPYMCSAIYQQLRDELDYAGCQFTDLLTDDVRHPAIGVVERLHAADAVPVKMRRVPVAGEPCRTANDCGNEILVSRDDVANVSLEMLVRFTSGTLSATECLAALNGAFQTYITAETRMAA